MYPIIGIPSGLTSTTPDSPFTDWKRHFCVDSYVQAIKKAGGIPVLLPVLTDFDNETIKAIVNKIDGLLIPGGIDVDPQFYNEQEKTECGIVNPIYDKFQIAIFKESYKRNIPVLGICRGLQLINIALGGTLYQDQSLFYRKTKINHQVMENCRYPAHQIEIKRNSILFDIFQKDKLEVNSIHHQFAKNIADNLYITAKSTDGVIEGLEDKNKKFVLAVQWHPEAMIATFDEMNLLFSFFIKATLQN